MSGYVRIHRGLIGHPAFRNDAEAMAFAWLIMRAAWRPSRVRYKDRILDIARGQLAISQRDMARALDRDKTWVERLWKRLKSEAMIDAATGAGVAVITICNYDNFQQSDRTREAPGTAVVEAGTEAIGQAGAEAGTRRGQGTEQIREESKKEDSPQPPRARAIEKSVLPDDWALPAVADLPPRVRACAEQWTVASYATRGEEFVSFWRSRGRMMKDWRLTWAGRVVDLHGQVMRDQKFGNAPTGDAQSMPDADRLASYDKGAALMDRLNRPEDAAAFRDQAVRLRGSGAKPVGSCLPPKLRTTRSSRKCEEPGYGQGNARTTEKSGQANQNRPADPGAGLWQ
ncbi:MAG: hypothetical protein H0W74_12800 [Sphingosinicella sp.]|nr:hypothetical protein [Sphingosinicella sp.]